MWTFAALAGVMVFLGAGAPAIDAAPNPKRLAAHEATEWVDDLGPVVSSELVYSDDFQQPVWRVRGTTTTVVMDGQYDLVGLEFHD